MPNPLWRDETANSRDSGTRTYPGQLQKNSSVPSFSYLGKLKSGSGDMGMSGKNGGKNIGMTKNTSGKDMNMSGKKSGYVDGKSMMGDKS